MPYFRRSGIEKLDLVHTYRWCINKLGELVKNISRRLTLEDVWSLSFDVAQSKIRKLDLTMPTIQYMEVTTCTVPGAPLHFELWLMVNGKQRDYKSIFEVRIHCSSTQI